MSSKNYTKGARKGFGDEVRVDEYWGLDPSDLPQVGDFVLLKTRAHELIKVTPSKSRAGTIRYRKGGKVRLGAEWEGLSASL